MKNIVKLIVALGLVCAIGCAALVWVNSLTEEPRRAINEQLLNDQLRLTLPKAFADCHFPKEKCTVADNGVVFHPGYRDSELVCFVVESAARGFGGDIHVLTGIDMANDAITRVIVSSHSETAGLGTQATDRSVRKSLWHQTELAEGELPPNAFLDQNFTGQPVCRLSTSGRGEGIREISGVSGATYSSRGVIHAVDLAMESYLRHKNELIEK